MQIVSALCSMLQIKAEFKKGVCPQNKKLTADKCHVLCHRLVFYLKMYIQNENSQVKMFLCEVACWEIIYEPAW